LSHLVAVLSQAKTLLCAKIFGSTPLNRTAEVTLLRDLG
jgi:hypothetical protein